MKYIKTYENQTLKKLEKLQQCRLSVYNFANIIKKIFDKYYNIKIILVEESGYNYNSAYKLTWGGEIICLFQLSGMAITVHFYDCKKKEFVKFIDEFFNLTKFYHKIVNCTSNGLNEISNKFLEEFDLFMTITKFNI